MDQNNNDDVYARPADLNPDAGNSLPEDFLLEVEKELESLDLMPSPNEEVRFLDELHDEADGLSADPGVRQMQITFLEICRNTLSPLSRYMKAMSQGESYRELLELSEMVVTPLLPKTEEVGLEKHADDITFFRSLLYLALGERDAEAVAAMREVVMEGYSKLSDRFGLSYRGYRLAVRNLVQFYRRLRSTEGVPEVDVRRFFAIGVPSLTWVRRTRASELSSLSGIDAEAIARIRKLAFVYRVTPSVAGASLAREEGSLSIHDSPEMEEVLTEDVMDLDVLDTDIRAPRGQA